VPSPAPQNQCDSARLSQLLGGRREGAMAAVFNFDVPVRPSAPRPTKEILRIAGRGRPRKSRSLRTARHLSGHFVNVEC